MHLGRLLRQHREDLAAAWRRVIDFVEKLENTAYRNGERTGKRYKGAF